jgi:hypothetical protein
MAKGIVRLTPKGSNMGKLEIIQTEPNEMGIDVGYELEFNDPGIKDLREGQAVNLNFTSKSDCEVLGICDVKS